MASTNFQLPQYPKLQPCRFHGVPSYHSPGENNCVFCARFSAAEYLQECINRIDSRLHELHEAIAIRRANATEKARPAQEKSEAKYQSKHPECKSIPRNVLFKYADRERSFDLQGRASVQVDDRTVPGTIHALSMKAHSLIAQRNDVVNKITEEFESYWNGPLFPVSRRATLRRNKSKKPKPAKEPMPSVQEPMSIQEPIPSVNSLFDFPSLA